MPPKPKKPLSSRYRKTTTGKPKSIPIPKTLPFVIRDEEDCKHVETLVGPIELDILDHPETGARIVLLGDRHVNEQRCEPTTKRCQLPVWLYLQKLFTEYKGQEPLDFFVESAFTQELRGMAIFKDPTQYAPYRQDLEKGKVFQNFIRSLNVYFYNCTQRVKEQCEFYGKPIRFHYSDVRIGVIHSKTSKEAGTFIKEFQHIWLNSPKQPKPKHRKILLKVIDAYLDKNIDYLFHLSKIDKQLNKLDMSIVMLLHLYMFNHMEVPELKQQAQRFKHVLESKTISISPSEFETMFTETVAILLLPLVDIYIFARMFRHNMKQVIVYAGVRHIRDMKQFLIDHFGFKLIVERLSDNENAKSFQCISLKNTPQPWFPTAITKTPR